MAEKMTAQQATEFEHGHSLIHTMILTQAAQDRGCDCKPYEDWFTYNRWQALGFQVHRGEKGIKLTTFVPIRDKDGNDTGQTRPWHTTVFCRHQVKEK